MFINQCLETPESRVKARRNEKLKRQIYLRKYIKIVVLLTLKILVVADLTIQFDEIAR